MQDFDIDTYRMWRPDLQEAIRSAMRQKKQVVIQTHWQIDLCNAADFVFSGKIVGLTGQLAQYVVESYNCDYGNIFPVVPECEYIFAAEISAANVKNNIEYSGKAKIVDQELLKNDLPESLLLRIGQPSRIRRLRIHKRFSDITSFILMPGILVMDQEPINRRKLLALLGHYYRQKQKAKLEIVDISAGGACLRLNDHRYNRFMGAEEHFLFFFFPEDDGLLMNPAVFLAKKVGILREDNSSHSGLRIRFLKELVWTPPNEDLRWNDITSEGSEVINGLMNKTALLKKS